MKAAFLPSTCTVALKEWATVLQAMSQGEQLILIRKGGLIEPGGGFEIASPVFVFYPTFEHQAVHYLRERYGGYFEGALRQRAPEGEVRFDLCGRVTWSARSSQATIVERLRDFHIYNREFLTQRLKWQPDQPLVIAAVRAFRLRDPQSVPVRPSYAGCKSWVELESPISLEGARPVLEEPLFQERLREITAAFS